VKRGSKKTGRKEEVREGMGRLDLALVMQEIQDMLVIITEV